jgi:CubicO group peptidase (beta-lactamase class C family)
MNTRAPTLLVALLSFLLSPTAFAADAPTLPGVSDAIKPFIPQNEIAGAVTLVLTKDRILHLDAVGDADVEQHVPMKTDAIFWIASMTKPITGAAILMMQEEGKLSLDDPIAKFIPEFANVKTPSGKPANLTIKHLMTHTSGLGEASAEQQKAAHTLADLIPYFVAKPTSFEPGSKWAYCQSGINTLGRIIEITSGQPLPDFFQQRLFGPLGMKDSTFYPTKEQQARIARTYKKNKDKLEPSTVTLFAGQDLADTRRVPLANGGLYSTATDYGRFCQMLLAGGTLDGKTYLKPESVKQMDTIATQSVPTKVGFVPGSGWGVCTSIVAEPQGITAVLSPGTFGHGGAYGTQAWIDPTKGVAYVLMVQRANFPNADASDVRRAFQQAAFDAMK